MAGLCASGVVSMLIYVPGIEQSILTRQTPARPKALGGGVVTRREITAKKICLYLLPVPLQPWAESGSRREPPPPGAKEPIRTCASQGIGTQK